MAIVIPLKNKTKKKAAAGLIPTHQRLLHTPTATHRRHHIVQLSKCPAPELGRSRHSHNAQQAREHTTLRTHRCTELHQTAVRDPRFLRGLTGIGMTCPTRQAGRGLSGISLIDFVEAIGNRRSIDGVPDSLRGEIVILG